MNTKHTPGQIKAHGLALITTDKLPAQCIPHDPRNITIANAAWDPNEVDLEIPWNYDEAAANAARLALCWNHHDELVESLRGMLQAIEAMPPDYQDSPYIWSRTSEARAVLAKLEGGAK